MPHRLDASLTVFTGSTVQTNNTVSPLTHLLPFHLSTLSVLIGPRLTVKWFLSIRNLKVQKYSLRVVRALLCVCPSAFLQNLPTSHFSIRTSIPDLFRNSLYPAFFFSTLKEVGLGLSPNSCSESRTHICCSFSSPVCSQSF